ncbi:MAG: TetR family transcriptional regulator [Alphaproteobacteria bacterium]|nr:TetR family transcriptional regulator [Alphaproteobacteria bacterium]
MHQPSSAGREARHAALLDAAAAEFNARGISGASLARIAKALGLTRAALYYHVEDRESLAAACYARSSSLMAGDLAAAAREGNGLARTLGFLRRALDPERPIAAVPSELACLKGPHRREILAAHDTNIATLRGFVRAGIADGSIRACDDEIVAQTIVGIITWIPLSPAWVENTDASFRARSAAEVVGLFELGEAADPGYRFEPTVPIGEFFPQAGKAFDREAASAAKVEQLLMTASALFNRNGIDGTSLDEISAGLGATKGALYHYLKSKSELVARCYRRSFDLTERFADACERIEGPGLTRSSTGLWLNVQAHASGLSPLILMAGAANLPQGLRREITRRARKIQLRYRAFGDEGLKDGSFRALDFDAVAQAGAGAFEWLPKWFSPDDPRAKDILAREITDLFIRGLRTR